MDREDSWFGMKSRPESLILTSLVPKHSFSLSHNVRRLLLSVLAELSVEESRDKALPDFGDELCDDEELAREADERRSKMLICVSYRKSAALGSSRWLPAETVLLGDF